MLYLANADFFVGVGGEVVFIKGGWLCHGNPVPERSDREGAQMKEGILQSRSSSAWSYSLAIPVRDYFSSQLKGKSSVIYRVGEAYLGTKGSVRCNFQRGREARQPIAALSPWPQCKRGARPQKLIGPPFLNRAHRFGGEN